jgi:hypothetical protein
MRGKRGESAGSFDGTERLRGRGGEPRDTVVGKAVEVVT